MRLPGKVDNPDDKRPHYLTHGYIKQFNLTTKMFPNYDPNGKTVIYGLSAKTSGMYVFETSVCSISDCISKGNGCSCFTPGSNRRK